VIDGSSLDRPRDDGVEVERLVRDSQRPDVLAPAELLDAQLERLDHTQARLAILKTHTSRVLRLRGLLDFPR